MTMNYMWTPTFPMEDQKETMALLPLHPRSVDKRDLESEVIAVKTQTKKPRKSRARNERSSSPEQEQDSFGQLDGPSKDKGRGRYACLNHRMKHKRCPPDCKERRPRPMQNPNEASPTSDSSDTSSNDSSVQNHVLQLDNVLAQLPPPVQTTVITNPVAAPMGINPLLTVSALPSLETEWDKAEWEGLMDDSHNQWGRDIESWDDIPSAITNWESEGSDSSLDSVGATGSSLFDDPHPSTAGERPDLKELVSSITITRDAIERWLPEPHFDHLIQGFYVRARIGEYMDSSVYRIARIDEVLNRAFFTYNLGSQQTTKGLSLNIGPSKKPFSFLSVSNKLPTDGDLQHWEEESYRHPRPDLPTKEIVREREKVLRILNLKYPPITPGSGASTST